MTCIIGNIYPARPSFFSNTSQVIHQTCQYRYAPGDACCLYLLLPLTPVQKITGKLQVMRVIASSGITLLGEMNTMQTFKMQRLAQVYPPIISCYKSSKTIQKNSFSWRSQVLLRYLIICILDANIYRCMVTHTFEGILLKNKYIKIVIAQFLYFKMSV